ncbi:MAG: hypothetical protein IJ275_06620 [Ruminococcus sp.]|nr:hypothetical protein [Ruminococcus sp.]
MTQSVNTVAKAMKDYYGSDEQKVRHFVSVYTLAKTIGELEKLPEQTQEYLEIAALVCDIDNCRCSECTKARELLKKQEIEYEIVDRVCYILEHFFDYEHITGLDHQILLEAYMIVDFKEKGLSHAEIIKVSNARFMTNYGRAFLKRAFGV